jgi:hypothetical protein
MRRMYLVLFIGILPVVCLGTELPNWAFPLTDTVQSQSVGQDNNQPRTLPGSSKAYMQTQIDDLSNPPDWFPDMHPLMTPVVARGTETFACGSCHPPTGTGHDESAYLAALPASYIVRQMEAFKAGTRKGFGDMPAIARALSDDDFRSAANYFASLGARQWVHVVEAGTVPQTYVAPGNIRLKLPGGGSEAIAGRIVELPDNE